MNNTCPPSCPAVAFRQRGKPLDEDGSLVRRRKLTSFSLQNRLANYNYLLIHPQLFFTPPLTIYAVRNINPPPSNHLPLHLSTSDI